MRIVPASSYRPDRSLGNLFSRRSGRRTVPLTRLKFLSQTVVELGQFLLAPAFEFFPELSFKGASLLSIADFELLALPLIKT